MDVKHYDLFPTRLVTIQFADTVALNSELCELFDGPGFADGFNMHPDALNLLSLAETVPAVAKLRCMFLEGLSRWLANEGADPPDGVDLVLFSNYARRGEFTLVHNHNADLVGIYYVRTAEATRPPIDLVGDAEDYFEAGDGVLVLHDPRFNANLAATGDRDHVRVHPRPGLMLIFPGYLWHSVTPHLGESGRLSLSMNYSLRWASRKNPVFQKLTEG